MEDTIFKMLGMLIYGADADDKMAKPEPVYGDVIGVKKRVLGQPVFMHFGVYENDNRVIHFSGKGGFTKNVDVYAVSLEEFLAGERDFIVCSFPDEHGRPPEVPRNPIYERLVEFGIIDKEAANDVEHTPEPSDPESEGRYRIYSPEETVARAESCLNGYAHRYNLAELNCEHFGLWCKTGVTESHQINEAFGIAQSLVRVGEAKRERKRLVKLQKKQQKKKR